MAYYRFTTTFRLHKRFKTQRHKDRAVNNTAFTLVPLWHQFAYTHVPVYQQSLVPDFNDSFAATKKSLEYFYFTALQ
jgi:hypothetical protein